MGRLTGGILGGSVDNLSVPPYDTSCAAGEHSRVDGISALTLISVLPGQSFSICRVAGLESSYKYQPIVCHHGIDKYWTECILWTGV